MTHTAKFHAVKPVITWCNTKRYGFSKTTESSCRNDGSYLSVK